MLRAAAVVLRKEWRDALRDRRTLAMVLLSSVAMGPLVLLLVSVLVAGIEKRAEARELLVVGIEQAAVLRNYFERQTWTLRPPPPGHEAEIEAGRLADPVLVIAPGFDESLARGEPPRVELLASSASPRAQAAAARLRQALRGFEQEQATLRLAVRGLPPALLEVLQVEEHDLAEQGRRGAQLAMLVPFFVLMAVLYGALNAALDSTAGERERGSLEPLLACPAPRAALVLGKWAAVALVGLLIALLSCLSFLPAQGLLRSETLAALFHFGLREAALFLALLAPLAGALSALLMAIAIRCRSHKEAQAHATLLVLAVSLLPLVTLLDQEGRAPWHLWVPALAQVSLMGRVLGGETPGVTDWLLPAAVAAGLTVLGLAYVARALRGPVLK